MMENECQHGHGNNIGYDPKKKDTYKKYQVSRDAAKKNGVGVWDIFLCSDCGALIDNNDWSPLTNEQVAAWIDALMIVQQVRIIEFIEAIE